jgi:Holliday junction resolvase
MAQRESKLSRQIINAITSQGHFAFKVHGGPWMMAGLPDIVACIDGRFVCIETKMPDGKDPSPIQQFVHEKIRKAGGQVFVARSVRQALEMLGI